MSNRPQDELDATRAALAPTLQAVADILPLIAKARQPRFAPEKATRWQAGCERLAAAWNGRHGDAGKDLRPAIFALCAQATELADADCLRLAEALASATDVLEDPARQHDPRLAAALSAASEGLREVNGLELPSFSERARYLAQRLEQSLQPASHAVRTPALDRLFVGEAGEQLDSMQEAFELLPPDAYAIKTAAEEIVALAEPLELFDIMDRARLIVARLTPQAGENLDLDAPPTRADVLQRIALLAAAIGEIEISPANEKLPGPIVFPPPDRPRQS